MAAWTWAYADVTGGDVQVPQAARAAFPTQGEAETWFAQTWEDLAEVGVAAVTLHLDGTVVYGPMSLEPPS